MQKVFDKNEIRIKSVAKKTGMVLFKSFRFYLLIALSFVVIYPVLYMVSIAFRHPNDLLDPGVIWIPKTFVLSNITEVFKIINYPKSLMNTTYISIVSTILQMITCGIAGYGFARFKFKGKNIIFGLLLFSILIPTQTITIPLYPQITHFDFLGLGQVGRLFTGKPFTINLFNTPAAIFLPALLGNGIRSGMYIFIFRQFFVNLPKDLEDAAYIDGCGFIQTYLRVIIPCASSPFLVVFILSIIWYWNDVLTTVLFYFSAQTLAQSVDGLLSKLSLEYDYFTISQFQQAACLLLILPVLIMYLVLQRFFIQSIDRTGLK